MVLIMNDRFIIECLPSDLRNTCGDHYCTGHTVWVIKDTKTNKTLTRFREPIYDRLEEMNFIVECIEESNGT